MGHLDTVVSTVVVSTEDTAVIYIKESDISLVEKGMTVNVNEQEYTITEISDIPRSVDETFSDYALHIGSLEKGEWVYEAHTDEKIPHGIYSGDIVTESVSPISFVIN